jgi:SAM-dependent methyltransferase
MTTAIYPLYEHHADLWPLLAPLESYEDEMRVWADLIRAELGDDAQLEILDLGSGGGHHLYHLAQALPGAPGGVAVDLSPAMLARVRHLLPAFRATQGDMTRLALEARFPLVTVHDSFCYLVEIGQVRGLFETIARHLEPDGLALVKLDALAGEFQGPYRYLTTFEDDDREITLTHYEWDPDPSDTWIEVIYLFLERRLDAVASREERHRLGLFSREQLRQAWRAAGLKGKLVELERWDEERPNPLLVLRRTLAGPKGQSRGEATHKRS